MRLGKDKKQLFMRHIDMVRFLESTPIDLEKLEKCNIERLGGNYYIVMSKENIPKSNCALPLDVDIASQPDIVLIAYVCNDGGLRIEITDKTERIRKKEGI